MKKGIIIGLLISQITQNLYAETINLNIHEPIIGVKTITKQIVNCNKRYSQTAQSSNQNITTPEYIAHKTNTVMDFFDRTGVTMFAVGALSQVPFGVNGYQAVRGASNYGEISYKTKHQQQNNEMCTKQTQTYDINTVVGYNNCAFIRGEKMCKKSEGYIWSAEIKDLIKN